MAAATKQKRPRHLLNRAKQVRLLVLRGGAIGDFIVTLPALRALRRQWPEAYIELVAYPHIAQLALAGGLVDKVTSLHGAHIARFYSLRPEFPAEQVAFIRSFDLVVSFLHDPDRIVGDNLERAGARQLVAGSPLVEDGHAIDQMARPLEALAIYARGESAQLALGPADREAGRDLLGQHGIRGAALALHPGSGSPKKNWPLGRFIDLARRAAREGGRTPFFLTGEADAEVETALRRNAPDVALATGLPLLDTARLLSACAAYVGNDSGITHLAAALGVPTVALFGPSDADRWAPRGDHVRVLRAPGGDLDALPVDDVWRAIEG